MATACIMVPEADRTCEPNHHRYDRTCIAEANVRGLSRRLPGSSSLVLAVVNSAVALTVDKPSCELVVVQR